MERIISVLAGVDQTPVTVTTETTESCRQGHDRVNSAQRGAEDTDLATRDSFQGSSRPWRVEIARRCLGLLGKAMARRNDDIIKALTGSATFDLNIKG
ncbi:hypothetical protein D3C73_823360 [compost metagenome]